MAGIWKAFVVEADSNMEPDEMLHDLPLWGVSRMGVTPLQPIEERLEYERRLAERVG